MSKFGGGSKCPCCGKTVYMAEEVVAAGQKYHKMCFKCSTCNKMLDSSIATDHEGKLFCKSCHGRNFGMKGYGYGGGAGTLASEAGHHATDGGGGNPTGAATGPTGYSSYGVTKGGALKTGGGGDGAKFGSGSGDKCPRCGKSVYIAEKIVGAGSSWHKSCFACSECKKKLDSTTVCDKDGEIFCKSCYGKHFGPKGVGFGGGAGTLTTT